MPDLISDIHLDFYVRVDQPDWKMRKNIDTLVQSLLPTNPSNTLIIAGDIGHYNHQNIVLLDELRKHYGDVILVTGNHDLYLISSKARYRYKNSSMNRVKEFIQMTEQISGIHVLNGQIVELEGIVFGGCMGWYDFSYAAHVLDKTKENAKHVWRNISNDSRLIRGSDANYEILFQQEFNKLNSVIEKSDIIITHVGGEWSQCNPSHKNDMSTSFYYFDGSYLFDKIKGKSWCFGHDHHRRDYEKYGCRFVNAALGYPDEHKGNKIVRL